jgi:hypothetical protein
MQLKKLQKKEKCINYYVYESKRLTYTVKATATAIMDTPQWSE